MSGHRTVRVGVIGVGQIGKRHVAGYVEMDDVEIVAIADLNEQEAGRVAGELGATMYTDFRALLERDDIEAVDVCLHNNLHAPVTIAAMRAGKDVYCEKPIAGSYVDGRDMIDAAAETGRSLSIQLSSLFRPEPQIARTMIDAGDLGEVYHGRSTGHRRRGRPYVDGYGSPAFVSKQLAAGGALFDMGIYHVAEILYLMDNPAVARISGRACQHTAMDEQRQRDSGYDVEELAMGFVRFEDGRSMDLVEAWAVHLDAFESSYVLGSDGGLRLRPLTWFHSRGDLSMNTAIDVNEYQQRQGNLRDNADAYRSPQRHWIAALQGRVPLLPTAEIALRTMLISQGLYLSSDLGREVTAEEVVEGSRSTIIAL